MSFNIGKIFRTIVNPIIGKPTPAAQSAAYQQQGMSMANQVATNYNNQVMAIQNQQAADAAAASQASAVQAQQAKDAQLQADNMAAQDNALRQSARQASLGSTANTLYGNKYKKSDETTSSVLLGM